MQKLLSRHILASFKFLIIFKTHPAYYYVNYFFQIHFLNSEVMALSDTDIAFEGLENSLTELRATKASYVAHWDWNQLRNLKALELIDVANVELGSISARFPALNKLKFLGITNAHIYFIIQYAFADLKELTVLNLKGNEISEVNRNMFPEPAYNLLSIDLRYVVLFINCCKHCI